MNIGELFLNIGITGADKTVGALSGVKKGLGEVASMSLEAKAGILAAMYGLERMMSISGQAGTNLTNFGALTGLSAQNLQKWQYAARQAGVSGEELTGSLKGVQNTMTNMLMGKGAPEGMGIVARAVGFDPKRARDSFYVMEQLQKAAQKLPQDLGNNVLKSFGLSEGTISAMRRNAFNPGVMSHAPAYSDKELGALDKANIGWSNLGQKIEMAFGHFNAKHGGQLVNDISKLTTEVFKLVDAFTMLAEKLKLFKVIGMIFQGWNLLTRDATKTVNNFQKEGLKGRASAVFDEYKSMGQAMIEAFSGEVAPQGHQVILPSGVRGALGQGNSTTTIHQNIVHHGDAKDTKAVKDTHMHAINQAYRQRAAQRQGS